LLTFREAYNINMEGRKNRLKKKML
jgi:hypothetical protein